MRTGVTTKVMDETPEQLLVFDQQASRIIVLLLMWAIFAVQIMFFV